MRLLEKFSVLLLDMNGTFMFGEDRFSIGEDFFQTYQLLGGTNLTPSEVTGHIRRCYDGMIARYTDPNYYDDFPSLREGLQLYAEPPENELPLLESVFAKHEIGFIPESYAELLERLARTHRLGLVTNIWASKELWLEEFDRAGIGEIFLSKIFSSDSHSIKPSPLLYQQALDEIGCRPDEALFIGDSLRADIEGAKTIGLTTIWITNRKDESHPCVDYAVSSLHDIEDLSWRP